MKINICGDFYISQHLQADNIVGEDIKELFQFSDLNIINLESPITKDIKKHKIIKTGPHLNGNAKTFSILQQINTHIVTLANNHIMDYGINGLRDTISECQKNSINFTGAGMSREEAQRPFLLERYGLKIAILNFAENEWANSDKNMPGASPLDIVDNVKLIIENKKNSDVVIVIIHGGYEYYHLPSPRMVKQYRFYAENGADIIVGHHTHCISGFEIYKDVPIFYSLGNFLFTLPSMYKTWYTGIVLELSFKKNGEIKFKLHPVKQNEDYLKVHLLKGKEKEKVINEVITYNHIISDEEKLELYWKEFLKQNSRPYLRVFNPINCIKNRYIRGFLYKMGVDRLLLNDYNYKELLNIIRCESHADAVINIINDRVKGNENSNSS